MIPHCNSQRGITQPIIRLFLHICRREGCAVDVGDHLLEKSNSITDWNAFLLPPSIHPSKTPPLRCLCFFSCCSKEWVKFREHILICRSYHRSFIYFLSPMIQNDGVTYLHHRCLLFSLTFEFNLFRTIDFLTI